MTNYDETIKTKESKMSKKDFIPVSKHNENKVLGRFNYQERCSKCFKFANINQMYVSDDKSSIIVVHKCPKCESAFSFGYSGGFVSVFIAAEKCGQLEEELERLENQFNSTKEKEEVIKFEA